MRWLDEYRSAQISLARDQLRSHRGTTASRNNAQGRLARLQGKQRGRVRGNAVGYKGTSRGGPDISRLARDVSKAMRALEQGRPGADQQARKAMMRLSAQLGGR